MALEIIGAGYGRTGTLSTKTALEQLGFGPCHHMKEIFDSRDQLEIWRAAVRERSADWDQVFDGYRSCVDWPSTCFWKDLVAHYPDAKVVVTTRPVDGWVRSMQSTVCRLIAERHERPPSHVRDVLDLADEVIAEWTFEGQLQDAPTLARVFEQRLDEVAETIAPERLLLFDVRQGWQPLCEFLDVPVPDHEFPKGNDAEEFWTIFGRT